MSLKTHNFSYKLNFFKKLSLLSIGVVFLTIFIGFIFNFLFFDKFYIHRKQMLIKEIRKELIIKLNDSQDISEDIEDYQDRYGVRIDLLSLNACKHRNRFLFNEIKKNENFFIIREPNKAGLLFIRYYELLPNSKVLSIRISLAVMKEHLHDMFIFNIFIAIFSIIISCILVFFFSKKLTSNINYLKLNAEKIAKLEYPKEISLKTGDELEDLSNSLNKMSKELSNAINSLKSFVSNASHELKTPISILYLYSKALLDNKLDISKKEEYYKILLKKSLEMKELTESLLSLSKFNSPDFKLNLENTDIKNLIERSLESYDYLEFSKDILINKKLESIIQKVDSKIFNIAINNLVQNMLKYAPSESKVSIVLNSSSISFKNSFHSTIDKNKIFEPFYRGENSLNGSIEGNGLGLSLVKKILDLHKFKYLISIDSNIFEFKIYFI